MKKNKDINDLYSDILKFKPRPRDLRRAKIIEGVIDIMATQGVDDLTFESIGRKVGMARSHVVYYFKDREALVEAAVKFVASTAQQVIAKHLTNIEEWNTLLIRFIEANFNWVEQYPKHASVGLLLYYQASFQRKYRSLNTKIRTMGTERIESILKLGPYGKKKNAANIRPLAKGIQAIITGNLVQLVSTDRRNDVRLVRDETIQLVEKLLNNSLNK